MSITWNGVSSDTIGVIVERIPNRYVPTRRFSPQQVAGRNGNILLVDKSFPNVEQEYEVYLSAEAQGLPSVARACAEWLMGPDGYCRLQDSYDTTVYREAFLMGGYDLENILNKFGRCTITFSCKPQKYLLTGDTPIEIPAGITTYTGDVVQFDGITGASITSLSTTISPIQDLHGYDSPWPGGGGINKADYPAIIAAGATEQSDGSLYVPSASAYNNLVIFQNDGTAGQFTITFKSKNNGTSRGVYPVVKYTDNTTQALNVTGHTDYATVTLTTNSAKTVDKVHFSYGSNVAAWFYVQVESGATAHDWTPYSNICPISGRTGLSVYRTGVNVWDEEWELGIISSTTGGNVSDSQHIRSKNYSPCLPDTSYYGFIQSGEQLRIYWYDKDKNFISSPVASAAKVYTTPSNCYYFRFVSWLASYGTTYNYDISINYPSTDHDYHAYNGNTYAVDWTTPAGTVYGGTVDVVTGVLTVDWASVDMGTLNWFTHDAVAHIYACVPTDIANVVVPPYTNRQSGAVCSIYPPSTTQSISSAMTDKSWLRNAQIFYVRDTTYSNVNNFKADVDGQTLVYELATPITYQLTPQEIEVLVGENNVWTSSGPVSVTVEAPFVGTVTNPTPFEARPMLEVSGVGEITINGKTIQILESVSDFDIDCESMEAEDNSKIYCMDFPYLEGGENEIAGDGSITALTVTPRWWTL